ncbi:hypothetical protein KI387_014237, partial [Taxus chinensis]
YDLPNSFLPNMEQLLNSYASAPDCKGNSKDPRCPPSSKAVLGDQNWSYGQRFICTSNDHNDNDIPLQHHNSVFQSKHNQLLSSCLSHPDCTGNSPDPRCCPHSSKALLGDQNWSYGQHFVNDNNNEVAVERHNPAIPTSVEQLFFI